jgi:hypothetical protein
LGVFPQRAISKDHAAMAMTLNPPATDESIQTLRHACEIVLPDAYLAFLRASNGGSGDLGIEPGCFDLWPAEELLELNAVYEVPANVPGYFAFGGDGGGEMFAFRIVAGRATEVYMIPFIGMEEGDAVLISIDFVHFREAMGQIMPEPDTP